MTAAVGGIATRFGAGPGLTPAGQLDAILRDGDRAAGGLLPTTGNSFDLHVGADSFIDALVRDLRGAKRQINVTMYALHVAADGGPSQRVLDALRERAAAGIPVTLIIDEIGSGLLTSSAKEAKFLQGLRDAGIDVRVKKVTPARGEHDDARFAVDHRKIYEIDGRVTWQGGINLVDAWAPWHDLMLRAEGPVAAQAGALLAGRWRDLGGDVTATRAAVLHEGLVTPSAHARAGATALTRQLSSGSRTRRELDDHFVRSANSATRRLWIANPYLGDERAMHAAIDAARRGVDVRLMLVPADSGQGFIDAAIGPVGRAFAYRLREAGGTVVQLPSFSHAKAWIADDEAVVGTLNFDLASRRNYENAIATQDPDAVAQVERMFAAQQRSGHVATDAEAGRWHVWAVLRDLFGIQI